VCFQNVLKTLKIFIKRFGKFKNKSYLCISNDIVTELKKLKIMEIMKIIFESPGEYLDEKNVFYSKKYDANYIISNCKKVAIVNSSKYPLYSHYSGRRMRDPKTFENIEIPVQTKIYKTNFAEHGTMALYRAYWVRPFMKSIGYYNNKDWEFSTQPFRERQIILEICSPGEHGMPFVHSHALSHEEMNEVIMEIFLSQKKEFLPTDRRDFWKIKWEGPHSHLDITFWSVWNGSNDAASKFDSIVSGFIKMHAHHLSWGLPYPANAPKFKIKEATEIVAKIKKGMDCYKYKSLTAEDIKSYIS